MNGYHSDDESYHYQKLLRSFGEAIITGSMLPEATHVVFEGMNRTTGYAPEGFLGASMSPGKVL